MSMGSTKVRLAAMLAGFGLVASVAFIAAAELPKTKHINRAIELLEQGQPIYYTGSHSGTNGSFEQGKKDAQTYADYISYDMEHAPFDVKGLSEYMEGLVAGGPTQERTSHAGGDRERAGERARRSVGARQRLDVPAGAGDRSPRDPADPRRFAGRGAGIFEAVRSRSTNRDWTEASREGGAGFTGLRRRRRSGASRRTYLDKADAWP